MFGLIVNCGGADMRARAARADGFLERRLIWARGSVDGWYNV